MLRNDERECLREALRDAAPEMPVLVPIHLSGCQAIADCFMVNRQTVREWRKAGAPVAMIGGRLTAEYNMLMHWRPAVRKRHRRGMVIRLKMLPE